MLKRESRPAIKDALKKVEAAVRADKTKEGLVQFRIEQADLDKLYDLAEKHRKPLGAMVREWVLERARNEEEQTPSFEKCVLERLDAMQATIDLLGVHRPQAGYPRAVDAFSEVAE